MPDHPRAATEAEFTRLVTDLLTVYHWRWYHTHDSRHSAAGFPDLFCIHPRFGALALELKTDTGRLTLEQVEWLNALNAAGVRAEVWRPSTTHQHMISVLAGAHLVSPGR